MGKETAKCYNSPMPADEKSPKVLYADPEHGPLRFVIILLLFLNLIISFLLIQLLLNLLAAGTRLIEFATVISCALTIPLALGITWVLEIVLKREWHSGKSLVLEDSNLIYNTQKTNSENNDEDESQILFNWSKRVNILYWYFHLKGYPRAGRERRVPSKWLGLSCQLQQDDSRMITFSYLAPKHAVAWIENEDLSGPFVKISLDEVYKQAGKKNRQSASRRPTLDSSLLTSPEGRYWLAEQKRWQAGIELTQKDFETFINYVEQRNTP
jgi:hypothetical protein